MLAEYLMHRMRVSKIGYADPGPCFLDTFRPRFGGRFQVGDYNLRLGRTYICSVPFDWSEADCTHLLSPGGRTILLAVLATAWKRLVLRREVAVAERTLKAQIKERRRQREAAERQGRP